MSVIEHREGYCPTCGQHHLAESDTEELHALLTECNRLEREVLADNERLKQQLQGAVAAERERIAAMVQRYADAEPRGSGARMALGAMASHITGGGQ